MSFVVDTGNQIAPGGGGGSDPTAAICLDNGVAFQGDDTGGVCRNLAYVSNYDAAQFGDVALSGAETYAAEYHIWWGAVELLAYLEARLADGYGALVVGQTGNIGSPPHGVTVPSSPFDPATDTGGFWGLLGGAGGNYRRAITIESGTERTLVGHRDAPTWVEGSTSVQFGTLGTERMRLGDDSGLVIGTAVVATALGAGGIGLQNTYTVYGRTTGGAWRPLLALSGGDEPTLGSTASATVYQGGAKPQARAVSGAYTLDASGFDEILEWDLSGGNGTFTLPAPSATYANRTVMIQIKGTGSGNSITTSVSGGTTINGAASQVLNTAYATQSFRCLADGSLWQLLV